MVTSMKITQTQFDFHAQPDRGGSRDRPDRHPSRPVREDLVAEGASIYTAYPHKEALAVANLANVAGEIADLVSGTRCPVPSSPRP